MSYYKYVPPKRVDILENLQIRFTQVSALNDPFEAFPAVRLPDGEQKGDIFGESAKIEAFQSRIRLITDSTFAILSLSKTPDNILMWSHYANAHCGFVIQFDSSHKFFKLGTQEVKYALKRPPMIACDGDHYTDLFSTKSPDWAYEQEVRKSLPLHNKFQRLPSGNKFVPAIPATKENPETIHLFEIPKDLITGIIFGWKSDNKLRFAVADALRKNSMTHVQKMHAIPSKDEYRMEIISLSEKR